MVEEKFVIQGGNPLKGEIEVRGAKNAAFPVLAASLLTDETCVIENVPLIEDVLKMLKIMEVLGVKISWIGQRKIEVNSKDITAKVPLELIGKFRGSILLIGVMLARFGSVKLPPPGGCIIGARPIDTHLDAFKQLGVKINLEGNQYNFRRTGSLGKQREVVLKEKSVTATLNVLLYSAVNPKKTTIKIADLDYQVYDLVQVLGKMGAEIKKDWTNIEITGRKKLKGFKHSIMSDPIETGTFIIAALATKGEMVIREAGLPFLSLFLKRLEDFGAKFQIIDSKTIKIRPSRRLEMDKIQSLPYPGIHSDLQPELGVLATQTKGPTLIHDPLFEGRLKYLEELNKMGADIVYCDPHRAIIYGPTQLQGIQMPSSDLRAGAAMVIAGLVAKGTTEIHNIYQIDRGYEKIEERLQGLGADIKRRIKS